MSWPLYPDMAALPPGEAREVMEAHTARQTGAQGRPGPQGDVGLALDVWREGAHLWRSYGAGQPIEEWAARTMGPEFPRNFDDGPMGMPGVIDIQQWPVPTIEDAVHIGGAAAALETIRAMAIVGTYPDPATDIPKLMTPQALLHRLRTHGETIIKYRLQPVSVRAFLVNLTPSEIPREDGQSVTWRAWLKRREARGGVPEGDFTESTVTFQMDALSTRAQVMRAAKERLGIRGWPLSPVAAQQWNLARAAWTMGLELVQ